MIFRFKYVHIFVFLSNIPHFFAFWLFHDVTSLFLILLTFLQWNLHTQYIFNQDIYRTKWFIILESQFIDNLELFQTKRKDFWLLHWVLWVVFYVLISWENDQKNENIPQFNTVWLASLRARCCFRLSFGLSNSGYGFTVIKKNHILNCHLRIQKFLLKTQIYKFVVGNCGISVYC